MKRGPLARIAGGLAAGGAAALSAYLLVIRPWHLKWGATNHEACRPMPGDDLVPNPRMQSTRAITIRAPAADVWPWLVQIGYQRAGWYSYDRLEAIAGVADFVDGHSANRIMPELQDLKVGDTIPAAPEPYVRFTVTALEPNHVLALHAKLNPLSGRMIDPGDPQTGIHLDGSWVFLLEERDQGTTRLIARFRADYEPRLGLAPLAYLLFEPAIFIMERKMLLGIKERAEAKAEW